MERKSVISSEIWNNLSEEEIRSLVCYLRLLGHPVEEIHLPKGKIPQENTMVLDHEGDLYSSCRSWPTHTEVELKDIRKMIALGNFT